MRILRDALSFLVAPLVIVLALWTIGACAGVVVLGFCMVAGCRV